MILSFVDIEVVFCTLILCASGYYFFKPVAKHEKTFSSVSLISIRRSTNTGGPYFLSKINKYYIQ